MIADKSEAFDEVCEQAHNEKIAEPYTWAQVAELIVWKYFIFVVAHHLAFVGVVSMYVFGFHSVPLKSWTIFWLFFVGYAAGLGITAGVHRLWSHRAYKANLPFKIILIILCTTMGGNPIYYWIRDHRVHHKYSETDADPHNASRGFIFAHIGWTVMKRHPECLRRGKEVDMSDIEADEVVMFQKKYEVFLKILFCLVIPVIVPIVFWNETVLNAILTQWIIRYVLAMNFQFSVNSVAHFWGSRPYNKFINPVENAMISLVTMGEGSHNFHHTFPWDYKTGEFPYANFNGTTLFIDWMTKIGWASDRRETSPEFIEKVTRSIGYRAELKVE